MRKMFSVLIVFCLSTLALHAGFLDEEKAQALREKKLILVSIESETCPYCKKMKREIFHAPEYRKKIDQMYIYVPINVNDPSLPDAFKTKYIPAHVILSPAHPDSMDDYVGYIEPKTFMEILNETYHEVFKQ